MFKKIQFFFISEIIFSLKKKKKDADCSDERSEFFFVRFLVFKLLSILYLHYLSASDLGVSQGTSVSMALQNMPLTLTCSTKVLILKYAGSRGAAPAGGGGAIPAAQKKFVQISA